MFTYIYVFAYTMNVRERKEFKRLQKAQLKAHSQGNLKEEAELCNALGELLAQNGEYRDAIQEHRTELHLSEALNDAIGIGVACRKIGECYSELNMFDKALKYQNKHLELAQSHDNHVEEQRALATIGRTYLCQAEMCADAAKGDTALQKAQEAFVRSLGVCDKLKNTVTTKELQEMRARLFLNLGLVYDNQQDQGNCAKFIKQAVFIAEKYKLLEDLYRAHFSLGGIYLKNNNKNKSLRCLEAAVKCAKEMKEKYLESEAVAMTGTVFFRLSDFTAAKHALKKSYKLGSRLQHEKKQVVAQLRAAIKGCKLLQELEATSDMDLEERMPIYESLGDLCCKVVAFDLGIEYYHKQLKCALMLNKGNKVLIPIYVSLAATYQDIKKYDKAIECYRKELELRQDNPKENVKTWLNIAQSQEDNQADYATLYKSYKEALDCAERSNIPKLQMRTLKSMLMIQDKFGREENKVDTEGKLSNLKETYGLDSDDDLSGVDDSEIQDSENIEMDELELSDSDDSENEEHGRRSRNKLVKRNEKGETPLHRAAIDGNFKLVQILVEKGHPVNCRDYCGWLPLHEACNFGHHQIVEYLLNHGALVNDRGGEGCGGVTPLHDSINCGNFDIAELLINRGANVLAKDSEGNMPLDTLVQWKNTYKEDIDGETLTEVAKLMKILTQSAKQGSSTQHVSATSNQGDDDLFDKEEDDSCRMPSPLPVRPRHEIRTSSHSSERRSLQSRRGGVSMRRNLLDVEDDDDDNESYGNISDNSDADVSDVAMVRSILPATVREGSRNDDEEIVQIDSMDTEEDGPYMENSAADFDDGDEFYPNPSLGDVMELAQPPSASNMYQDAISNVGSRSSRPTSSQLPRQTSPANANAEQPALIPEEYYTADDWLINDVRQKPSKRKRMDVESVFRQAPNQTTQGSGSGHSAKRSLSLKNKPRKTRQLKLTNMSVTTSVISQDADRSHRTQGQVGDDLDIDMTDTSVPLSQTELSSTADHVMINSGASAPMRVRVKVHDKIFLIPVPTRDKTISWLTEQSTHRYYTVSGHRPNLVLMTSEGALFSAEDTIMDVVSANEEIIGEVQSWNLQPLPERYSKACESSHTAEHPKVRDILASSHNSNELAFKDLALTTVAAIPLFKALQRQYSIKQLLLPGNQIKDGALHHLAEALTTMPDLSVLDLSGNVVTEKGLKVLASALGGQDTGNVEGDLQRQGSRKPLQSLEVLDLSFNPLSDSCTLSLAAIIKHCPLLSTLKLTSCQLTVKFFQSFQRNIHDALQGAVHLHTLVVSYNNLGSTGVELLLKCLPPHLMSLDLSYTLASNNSLAFSSHVKTFLTQTGKSLQTLNLSGCFLTNEDLRNIASCLPNKKNLSSLSVSANSKLGNCGLQSLVSAVQEHGTRLGELDFTGCSVTSPLDPRLSDALRNISDSESAMKAFKFSTTSLSSDDVDALCQSWTNPRPNTAAVTRNDYECVLYTRALD